MKFSILLSSVTAALLLSNAPALAAAAPGGGSGLPTPQPISGAGPTDVRVYVTFTIAPPLEAVKAQAEKAIGKKIVLQYGSARGNLRDAILQGNGEFELAIMLPDVDAQTIAAGKVMKDAHELARVPVAFGIRGNANVDVSTPAAVKKALLEATSVKYSPTGAALMTVRKVFGTLGIADQIKDDSAKRGETPLTGNQYELGIYPLSEVLVNPNYKNLGPVVQQLQEPAIVTATVGMHTRDEASARALIKFLQSPAIDAELKKSGMEKGKL